MSSANALMLVGDVSLGYQQPLLIKNPMHKYHISWKANKEKEKREFRKAILIMLSGLLLGWSILILVTLLIT